VGGSGWRGEVRILPWQNCGANALLECRQLCKWFGSAFVKHYRAAMVQAIQYQMHQRLYLITCGVADGFFYAWICSCKTPQSVQLHLKGVYVLVSLW